LYRNNLFQQETHQFTLLCSLFSVKKLPRQTFSAISPVNERLYAQTNRKNCRGSYTKIFTITDSFCIFKRPINSHPPKGVSMHPIHPTKSFHPSLPRLRPMAEGLLLGGHSLLFLALEDYILRLANTPSSDTLLYPEHFAGSVSSALVILWMTILGLDLLERKHSRTR
jgi:hypothetical protein